MVQLSIGEFAHASGLTPKALRLYDELGLLAPATVDPRSGYRSYDRAQLDGARVIAALRGIGMPLARIRVVCALPSGAAAVEVRSYWRQVEADTRARGEQVSVLIDDLVAKETDMDTSRAFPRLDHCARTDRGLVRGSNEDAVFAGERLFAVADGFGASGADRGTGDAAIEALTPLDSEVPQGDPSQALGRAVTGAHQAVRALVDSDPSLTGAGTTLTAVLWSGTRFAVAHLGDTRLYLWRGGELSQITHDHTYVQSLVEEGKLSAEEAAAQRPRARLLRALHRDGTTEPDMHLREARPGDRYLLSSDGLHAVVDDARIRSVLGSSDAAGPTADRLIGAAMAHGAPDNLACVVIDVVADS